MKRLNKNGFTIIELLITIAIFGFTVPGLVALINTINGLNDKARDLSIINSLAENKVESLRSISFVGVNNGTYDFSNELPVSIPEPKSASYAVSNVTSALKQVDLNITYNDHGTSKTVNYRTYIGELGVGQY